MRLWRRLRSEQSGITLMELMVAIAISLVTLVAALAALEVVARQQPRISNHGLRIQEARAALEQMTRDLRQTYSVNSSSSASLDVLTYLRTPGGNSSEQRRVVYDCTASSCTRQEGSVDGALAASELIIDEVRNSDIFSYQPDNVNPRYVKVKFSFEIKRDPTDPAQPVTLSDGVQLRNTAVPG